MTEKDENRVHHLLDCCDVNGRIDIKADDMALILEYQRELGIEEGKGCLEQIRWERDVAISQLEDIGASFGLKMSLWLDEHDKAVRDKAIEKMAQIITKLDYDMSCVSECKHVDDGVSCAQCVLERSIMQMKEGEQE